MLKKWPAEEVAKGVMGGGGVVMRGHFSEEYLLPKGPMRPGVWVTNAAVQYGTCRISSRSMEKNGRICYTDRDSPKGLEWGGTNI